MLAPDGKGEDAGRSAPPPARADLLALDRDDWAVVVAHARRALAELDATAVTPAVKRLRSAPANKLLSGRSRDDLAGVFAEGGAAWVGLHRRLRDAEVRGPLAFLVEGTPREAPEPIAGQGDPRPDGRVGELEAEVARLRQKLKDARQERDDARRRADGATTRLQAAEAAAVKDAAELQRLAGQVATLTTAAQQAERDRERAVDRERRRQEAALAATRQEVTDLRRADEDRHKARVERERRAVAEAERARVQERERDEAERVRRAGAADLAAPGRPSEFPPGVAPGTTAHAKALLAPKRRILVDGYNVAKTQRPDLADEGAERDWLEAGLQTLIATRHVRVEVFWDGDQRDGSATRRGDLHVTFSPRDLTADDDIEFAVAAAGEDEPLVVVTDDRGLRDRLMSYRVDLLGTQAFGWVLRG